MRRSSTQARKARPGLEGLEGRQLLSTGAGTSASKGVAIDRTAATPGQDRHFAYTTPQGSHVNINVYGVGNLTGTTVDPDGALNLIFNDTNDQTGIIAKVTGGSHHAALRSVRNATAGLENFSGVNSSLLNMLNLKDFDLVDGGQINLTGGVHTLFLNSVGANTQIHLRELPATLTTTSTSATDNGVNLQFITAVTGARTLTSVAGTPIIPNFAALADTQQTSATTGHDPGPPPAPPGIVAVIGSIHGRPRASTALSDPEVFGYDSVANSLIRFDATTGAQLQSIPLTSLGSMTTGVALGRNKGQLVALVGNASTIFAFNALSGAPVGQFSTANLKGFTAIDGIGSTDNRTVLLDSTAGSFGMAQLIDVTASLATGQVVPVGATFSPQREFGFSGGMSGVAGSNTIYATGAGFFDTAQPNLTQAGVLALNTTGGKLAESSRTAIKSGGNFINAGPLGTAQANPTNAQGSIDQSLALVTGVSNGQNVVSLYNPSTQSGQGTITLNDPNRLSGLSESFRPDLVDTALIDIQGNLQSLRGQSAQGLVFNVEGYANFVKYRSMTDSTIVALPFAHGEIAHRSNVTILSSSRSVKGRNGVTVKSNLQPVGPLSLPTPG